MIGWLMFLYPRRFREKYGEEMRRVFEERLSEHRGRWRLWTELIVDTLRNAPAERWRAWSNRPSHLAVLPAPLAAWRRVKELHERLPREDGISRKAMLFAWYHAHAEGAREISVEHLVTGLLRADRRWARLRLGEGMEMALEAQGVVYSPLAEGRPKDLPLSAECKRMLERARIDGRLTRDGVLRAAGLL
jgi:hypothetical protein